MSDLIKFHQNGQWELLEKGSVKRESTQCVDCKKPVFKDSAIPLDNKFKDKITGQTKRLSTRNWICNDCFKKQYEASPVTKGEVTAWHPDTDFKSDPEPDTKETRKRDRKVANEKLRIPVDPQLPEAIRAP